MARAKKPGRKCRFESLENRRMMAGDVAVKVNNGNMTITGDNLSNGIVLSAGVNPYEIVVTGTTVAGMATRVNGVANGAITFKNITKDVKIKLGSGNDIATMNGVTVYESTKIKTGKGLDTVTISASTIANKLKVTTGKGFDIVNVTNTTVSGKATVKTGASRDLVTLNNLNAGKLNVSLGRGNDSLSISGTTVITNSVLKGGGGINTLATNNSFFGSSLLKIKLAGT